MSDKDHATFVLRIALGLFILIWGIAKFIQQDLWLQMFPMIYWGFAVGATVLAVFGMVEIALAAMLILGWKVTIAAWIGFLIQLLTTVAIIGRIAAPYGMVEADPLVKANIALFGTVVILAAWLALALSGKTGPYAIEQPSL